MQRKNNKRIVFNQWNDPEWLWNFFEKNISDLESYFKITDLGQAIYDTLYDSDELECLILDISPNANLDKYFRPLENNRTADMMLGREKAKPELKKMENVRNLLIEQGVIDVAGFVEFTDEL